VQQGGVVAAHVDAAVEAIDRLSRAACRGSFERRFDAIRMARDDLDIYQRAMPPG
jgi:hypothetical protein